jgi:hypothetical protein
MDTTSKSFYGDYAEQPDPAVPWIPFGHNQDLRSDLQQPLFGEGTSQEDARRLGEVDSGNRSAMIFNGQWIRRVWEELALGAQK